MLRSILRLDTPRAPSFLGSVLYSMGLNPMLKCENGHAFKTSELKVDRSFANNFLCCPRCDCIVTTAE